MMKHLFIAIAIAIVLGPVKAIDPNRRFLQTLRRQLKDEYYYEYEYEYYETTDYYNKTTPEECQCQGDTQSIIDNLENSLALISFLEEISDTAGLETSRSPAYKNSYIFYNDLNDGLFSSFDDICTDSGGTTVLTDVNVDLEGCTSVPFNYRGYPICIAHSCGRAECDKETSLTVITDMTYQGLDRSLNSTCFPEISFEIYSSLESPPSFDRVQSNTGDGGNGSSDEDTDDGTELIETLFSLGHSESCVFDMLKMYDESANLFEKAAETLWRQDDFQPIVIRYNDNATALSIYSEECTLYEGRVALVEIEIDSECFEINGIGLEITYDNVPLCVPSSCRDNEAESLLTTLLKEEEETEMCDIDVSIIGTLTPKRKKNKRASNAAKGASNAAKGASNSAKGASNSAKGASNSTKGASKKGVKTKKRGKSYQQAAKSEKLQCVADMAIIHGNELGMNPYHTRAYAFQNLLDCSNSPTDLDPVCIFNGNNDALEQYTDDCSSMDGRVVKTTWLFPDGCDGRDDGDFIDWIGVPDCVPTTCSDHGAAEFLNAVYFDPDDTSCYADISIVNMMPARKKKMKTAKSTKARRKK